MKNLLCGVICLFMAPLFAQSTLITDSLYSPALGKTERYQIYLPDGYTQNSSQRYPAIYFLHGALSDHEGYGFIKDVLDNLIASKRIKPMIVVKPNGNQGNYGGSMFANSPLYGKVEDFIVKDLVAHVDQKYRTVSSRSSRAVMGHSMGGDGAARYGILYPDVFCGFASHSGSLDLSFAQLFFAFVIQEQEQQKDSIPYEYTPLDGFATAALFRAGGAASPNLKNTPYFVDFPIDSKGKQIDSVFSKWLNFSTASIIRKSPPKQNIGIFFDCGLQDELGFLFFNNGFRDSLLKSNLKFTYQNFIGGHGDKLLDRLAISLPYLDSLMTKLSTPVVSISALQEQMVMKVYPNPGMDNVTLELSSPDQIKVDVVLQNTAGQELKMLRRNWSLTNGDNRLQLNLADLTPGMYRIILRGNGILLAEPLQMVK